MARSAACARVRFCGGHELACLAVPGRQNAMPSLSLFVLYSETSIEKRPVGVNSMLNAGDDADRRGAGTEGGDESEEEGVHCGSSEGVRREYYGREYAVCRRGVGVGGKRLENARLRALQPPECFGLSAHPEPGLCHVAVPYAPFPSPTMPALSKWSSQKSPTHLRSDRRSQRSNLSPPSPMPCARCLYGNRYWYAMLVRFQRICELKYFCVVYSSWEHRCLHYWSTPHKLRALHVVGAL